MDASAVKSMLMKRGVQTVKHVEIKQLWVQEAISRKGIRVVNVPRCDNLSDALASYSKATTLDDQLRRLGCERA